MQQATLQKKVSYLQREMRLLRSFVMGAIAKDKEGNYNPSFAREVMRLSREKTTQVFQGKAKFLSQIKKA